MGLVSSAARKPSRKINTTTILQFIIVTLSATFLSTLVALICKTHSFFLLNDETMRPFQSDESSITYAIMGATGMQGGAAIDYILSTGVNPSNIRALTRNKNSPAAQKLADKGVIVVEGKQDIGSGNQEAVDDCRETFSRLFDGVDCIFAITFTQYDSDTKEERFGNFLFEAIAQSLTVKQVVFSGGERTNIHLIDAKADIESIAKKILRETGIRCIFLHTSFFMENVLIKGKHMRFKKMQENGDTAKYELSLPLPYDRKIAMISARDIGTCAGRILIERPFVDARPYKALNIVGDMVSPRIFLDAMKEILPQYDFIYRQTKFEELKLAMGEAQANLVNQMYKTYYRQNSDEELTRGKIKSTLKISPSTKNIKEWIRLYAEEVLGQ